MSSPLKARYTNENPLEKLFYEAQPYLYISLAGYTLYKYPSSHLANFSSILLVFSAFLIIRWRVQFRGTKRR